MGEGGDSGSPERSPERLPENGDSSFENVRRIWRERAPGKLVGRGHPVGDFLDASDWDVLEEREGLLRVRSRLPERVMNPRGQLFGGFAPAYVDFLGLHTYRAGRGWDRNSGWLATLNMRIDYFEPVLGPEVEIEGRVSHRRGANAWIEIRFLDPEGNPLILAALTLREMA